MSLVEIAPARPAAGWWPEPIAPEHVARLRRELVAYYGDVQAVREQAVMCALGRQTLIPQAASYEDAARILCGYEAARLAAARLFYVSDETVRLIGAAYDGFPDTPSRPLDAPSECGLVVFGAPLLARPVSEEELEARAETAAYIGTAEARAAAAAPVYIVAAAWGPFAPDNWRGASGVWVTFYASATPTRLTLTTPSGTPYAAVCAENEIAWQHLPADGPAPGRTLGDYALPDDRTGTAAWGRMLTCLWAMMRQEHIVAAEPRAVAKTERRRSQREGLSDPREVVVVSYRRAVAEEEQAVNAALAGGPPGPARRRGEQGSTWYSVRFPVAAHWRNQWYPSEGLHRPKRIPAHWKGPADAPVRLRDRVELF